jgi:hypothetical protein
VTDAAGQGAGVQAWIGYSTTNTNPSTWTNWIVASFGSDQANNDEYLANLGAAISTEGTYYFASKFQYLSQPIVYGGFSASGGGYWDGTNNVSGILTVTSAPPPDPEIGFANIQWPGSGNIEPAQEFNVYAQVWIQNITSQTGQTTGLQSWIGYSTSDTDPSTWTDWIPATFNNDAGNNDEYMANLGAAITSEGTYYYASRFQYLSQPAVYGGFSASGGGYWDGTNNVSGILTVTSAPPPDPEIGFANIQWPGSGNIEPAQEFNVYAQVWIENITSQTGQTTGLLSWIGYSTSDTDPSTWTDWIPATFNTDAGNNDEYMANLGAAITSEGTYYYASRFQYLTQPVVYGGFSASGGGYWDGTNNVSGILTVTSAPPPDPEIGFANIQWPGSGTIEPAQEFNVYAQVWIENITSQTGQTTGLQSWIGYSTSDTDPSTWTDWIPATFNTDAGNNDEYMANLGAAITTEGTYYYASRFQYLSQPVVYGGFSDAGGGYWDGINNVSGILTVTPPPYPVIGFANIENPGSGTIETGQEFIVYALTWIEGITGQSSQTPGLEAWIGYSDQNTDPASWTNWISANYKGPNEGSDEFSGDIGTVIPNEGIWYYASRFKYLDQDFVYGGYSETGGGFWDGILNTSGELTVEDAIVYYPVLFTVTDATETYTNIKIKGDMTDWMAIEMNQNGSDWTTSLNMLPGTYRWGVIEDDGSPDGIWLMENDTLSVTVDDVGNITGDTSFVITWVGKEELGINCSVFPNPTLNRFRIEWNETPETIHLFLMNPFGELLRSFTPSTTEAIIDLSVYPSGTYFIILRQGDKQLIKTVLKQ